MTAYLSQLQHAVGAAGAGTGNESLRAEGQAEQTKGDLKQAGEKVKDAFKKH
jgi:uncharacterized protein YjbJ (UPF0337 family)